jgi:hypothetical protein
MLLGLAGGRDEPVRVRESEGIMDFVTEASLESFPVSDAPRWILDR